MKGFDVKQANRSNTRLIDPESQIPFLTFVKSAARPVPTIREDV